MIYKIEKEDLNQCIEFANQSVSTSVDKYSKRNQFDTAKIREDIIFGKLGEVYAHKFLIGKLPTLSLPDFKIYEAKDKSWDTDLTDNSGVRISVKTQNLLSKISFGESWVFQYNNGKTFDSDTEVFHSIDDKHFACFMAINYAARTIEPKAVISIDFLKKNSLFKEMKKTNLIGNKVAVYYEDIKNFNLWQI